MAPAYPKIGQDFRLHLYITDLDGTVVQDFELNADVASWSPASSSKAVACGDYVHQLVHIPTGMPLGIYQFMLAMVNDRTGEGINLDVDLTPEDGRYLLGHMQVTP